MSLKLSSQVAYNTIIQIIGKVIATILGLAAIAVMARYLREVGFGQYTTIITFLSFFGIIADFGLTLVTSRMISQPGNNQTVLLNNLFSLRLISAVFVLGLAPFVILFFPYEPIIKLGVAVAVLSFFFMALNQILVGFFQKNLTMTVVAIAEVVSRAILFGGIIITAYLNLGLLSIMATTVVSSLVSFIMHYWFSRRFIKIRWQINLAVWLEIIKKSWPLGLTIFFNLIYLRADIFILSLLKNQGEVGIYGATYKVIDVLTTLPFMFAGLILPILTSEWTNQNFLKFNRVLQKSFNVMIILAIPLIIGTQFIAEPLMLFIVGEKFIQSGYILKILILAIGFIFIGCLFSHAVIALDKQKNIIGAYVFTALTSLAGYLIFIPGFSYYGAAWVTVYSEFAIALFSIYIVIKYSRFRPDLTVIFKSIAASLIMALSIYLLIGRLNLVLVILLAGMIYLICLYLFKGVVKENLKIW
ncbi:flippase [Patescibacteria group bacterium]|nr:flippase [Patescibacteria group bacterium]MBU1663141.1 flippase [Patescibacteria group bacterium]MBU1933663.1 flippase [Patescibacteria group bacterium]MBU2008126.1 flippase [Patescibacteria group bacterium]MBU2233471.1 flippase [Patescibacteria group bacterium]